MRLIAISALFIALAAGAAETGFWRMLDLAKRGDSMARVVVGYAFLLGEYRDGERVERDFEAAYAWASLANYQGNPEAQALLDRVIPQLPNRDQANATAAEYFRRYGAEPGTYKKPDPSVQERPPHNKPMQTDDPQQSPSRAPLS